MGERLRKESVGNLGPAVRHKRLRAYARPIGGLHSVTQGVGGDDQRLTPNPKSPLLKSKAPKPEQNSTNKKHKKKGSRPDQTAPTER